MKVYQPKLTVGTEGKVLIDSTNVKQNSATKSNKKKSGNRENHETVKHKNKRKDGIYVDPPSAKKTKFTDASTQTEASSTSASNSKDNVQKVIEMMTSETPPAEYWEALAEKRRCALDETLEENQFLKDENEYLKGENKIMEEMLEEAKQLAVLIQSVTGDKDVGEIESSIEVLKPAKEDTNSENENQTTETENKSEKSTEETEEEDPEEKPINETEETRS